MVIAFVEALLPPAKSWLFVPELAVCPKVVYVIEDAIQSSIN